MFYIGSKNNWRKIVNRLSGITQELRTVNRLITETKNSRNIHKLDTLTGRRAALSTLQKNPDLNIDLQLAKLEYHPKKDHQGWMTWLKAQKDTLIRYAKK